MVSHEFKGYELLLLFSVASVTSAYITEEFANLLQSHHALTKVGQNSATSSGISTTVVRNGDDLVQTGFSRLGVETGRESLENRSSNETNSDSAKTRALCQNQKLDVVFVLDGSRTMTLQKFQNMLSFVNQMSGRMHIGKDKTRVGVMQYSSCIRPHIFLNQHYDVKELQNAIMRIKYEGKGTAVGRALKFAARRMFSKRKGTRDLSSGVRRMLILITDGKWSRQDEVRDGIRELENLNVERFAIGMGRSMRSVELGLLSSKPTKTHVHYVHHLSELNKVGYKILDELCTDRSCVNANINNEGLSGFDLLKSLNMKQQSGVSTIKGSKKDLNAFEIGPQTALQIFPASLLFPNNLPQNFAITTVFRMNELTPNENWSILEFRRSSGGALVSLRVIGSEKPNQIHFLAEDKNKQQQIYKFKGVDTLFQSGFHKLTLFVTPTRATVTVDCTLIGHVTLTYPAILSNSDGPIVVARNIRSDDSVVVDIQELSIWCNATYEGNSDEHFNCCGLPGQCESKASNNIQQQNIGRNSERQAETRFIPNKRREFNSNPAIVRPSGISSTRNENQNTANNVRVSRPHGIPGSSNRGVAPERSPPGHRRTTPHNRESQNRLTVPRPRQETVINVVPKPSTPPPTVQSLPTSDNCPKLPGPPGPRGFRGPKGHHGDTGEDGKIGYTGKPGLPGTPGANGPRGHQGDRGEPGPQGYRGHKGSRGIKGDMGPVGPKGQNGMTGPTGRPGMAGPRGRQGAPGEKGANGEKGTTGVEGDAGNPGATGKGGRPGKQGEKGSTGIVGLRGPRGHHGRPGIQGLPGRKGVAGPPGETGMPGLRGKPGSKGETGEPGTIGEEGPPGRPGNPGRKGDNGPSGDMGPRGDQGAPGEKGSSGLQGRPGRPGPSGFVGPKGHKGMEGPVGKKGNTGITGPQGLPGVKGEEGEAGPIGETGFKGDQGNRGPVGPMGLPGLKGEKGERGFEGPIGEAGISGRTGPRGPRGPPRSLKEIEALIVKALSEMMPAHLTAIRHQCQRCIPPSKLVQGKTGPPGENGRKGEKGREGPKGNTGPTGHIGLQGPRGERGLSGPMGDKGDMGERGHSIVGPMGPPGKPGQKGKAGKSYRGKDGTPGKQGIVGPRGNPGKPGAKGHEGVCDASNCGTQAAYVNPPHGFYPRDTKGPSPAQRPDDHGRPGHRGSPAQIPGEQVRLNISPRVLQQLKGPNRQHVYNLDDGLNQQTRQRNLN